MKSKVQSLTTNSSHAAKSCTLCGGIGVYRLLHLEDVPVHQNLLYSSFEAARQCKVGQIDLCACINCGFVFNSAFDSELLDYSEDYENSQDKSRSFSNHMESVAEQLVTRHNLHGKRILEIGCGKGGFLNLIVQMAGGQGKGFDPSYLNEYDSVPSLSFVKDFFPSVEPWWSPEQIICRHVLEHIATPYEFVSMIRNAIPTGQAPRLYFEVPGFDWIRDNLAFWDIFYEHCNYFTKASIANLMRACGFNVEKMESVFAGQYLSVDLSVSADAANGAQWESNDVEKFDYRGLGEGLNERMTTIRDDIRRTVSDGKSIAIWGAAAKGSTFLNQLKLTPSVIPNVIDINPRKQGSYIAGTGQKICGPEFLKENWRDLIYIMNPNYANEIKQQLSEMSLHPQLLVI